MCIHMCIHIYMGAYIYYSMDTNWSICKQPSYQHSGLAKSKEKHVSLFGLWKIKAGFLKKITYGYIYSFDLDPKHIKLRHVKINFRTAFINELKCMSINTI